MGGGAWASVNALKQAWNIQTKAASQGFDWSHVADVIDKVREELEEIQRALKRGDPDHARRELGDLLFAAVNLARFLEADPTQELLHANGRFTDRFAKLTVEVQRSGDDLAQCSIEELDAVWDRIKEEKKPPRGQD